MEKELEKFLKAITLTDKVFRKRGYNPYSVDIGNYLLTGNPMVFTSTYAARDIVSDIDLDKLNEQVKKSLIEETIVTLVESDRARLLSNNIPTIISNWTGKKIANSKDITTFDELYVQILKSGSISRYIGNSIQTAEIYFESTLNKLQTNDTPSNSKIEYLFKEREEILSRIKRNQR